MLGFPDFETPFILEVDFNLEGIGTVLSPETKWKNSGIGLCKQKFETI